MLQEAAFDTRFHPRLSRAAVVRRLLARSGRFGRVQTRFDYRRLPIVFGRPEEAEVNLDPGRAVMHGTVLQRQMRKKATSAEAQAEAEAMRFRLIAIRRDSTVNQPIRVRSPIRYRQGR